MAEGHNADKDVTSIVDRLLAIQAEHEAAERADEEPAITMHMDDDRIIFRDQAALDEYVADALDAGACPQGIHGWHQPAPNGLCPWCEWESLTTVIASADAADGDQPYCTEHGGYICTHLPRPIASDETSTEGSTS